MPPGEGGHADFSPASQRDPLAGANELLSETGHLGCHGNVSSSRPFVGRADGRYVGILLVPPGPTHQVLDGFAGVLALVQDGVDLLSDGHFDLIVGGKLQRGGGGENAFGNFAFESGQGFRKAEALAQLDAHPAVARERSGAGQYKVAEAGESGEGFTAASASHGEAGNLRNASGDEGGGAVVAEIESGDGSGGDGDDVFKRAAKLNSGHIFIGVEAQSG